MTTISFLASLHILPFPAHEIHHLGRPTRRSHNHPDNLLVSIIDLLVLTIRRNQCPVLRFQDTLLLVPLLV